MLNGINTKLDKCEVVFLTYIPSMCLKKLVINTYRLYTKFSKLFYNQKNVSIGNS